MSGETVKLSGISILARGWGKSTASSTRRKWKKECQLWRNHKVVEDTIIAEQNISMDNRTTLGSYIILSAHSTVRLHLGMGVHARRQRQRTSACLGGVWTRPEDVHQPERTGKKMTYL
jgi:hypothetical protein